jgi:hypothetical protein
LPKDNRLDRATRRSASDARTSRPNEAQQVLFSRNCVGLATISFLDHSASVLLIPLYACAGEIDRRNLRSRLVTVTMVKFNQKFQ